MENPFEFLRIDPAADIHKITEICQQRSQTATEEERRRIQDALIALRDEKRRLQFALGTPHNPEYEVSAWDRFIQEHRRMPFKQKDVVPPGVNSAQLEDIDLAHLEILLSQPDPEEHPLSRQELQTLAAAFDFDKMFLDYLNQIEA